MGKLETWSGRYLEDFTVGDVYQHQYGRTVIDADSLWFSAISMSANEQYFNRAYAEARGGSDLEVNPAFVMALVTGMSVSDISQNGVNLEWKEVSMPNPLYVGETVRAESEGVDDGHRLLRAGGVARDDDLRPIGVRQLEDQGRQALIGPHNRVPHQVVQIHPGPLAPQRLRRQSAGGLICPGPCPGGLAGPPQDVLALFVCPILPAVGRDGILGIGRIYPVPPPESVPQL